MEKSNFAQGDLMLLRINDNWPELARKLDRSTPLKRLSKQGMRLLEGEVTGHHHTIEAYSEFDIARMVEDRLTELSDVAASEKTKATLYHDDALIEQMIEAGIADPDNPDRLRQLAIGFLEVTAPAVPLTHPEHDAITLFLGVYYVGRQIESAGAEERIVAD